jgi:hypothetical protein
MGWRILRPTKTRAVHLPTTVFCIQAITKGGCAEVTEILITAQLEDSELLALFAQERQQWLAEMQRLNDALIAVKQFSAVAKNHNAMHERLWREAETLRQTETAELAVELATAKEECDTLRKLVPPVAIVQQIVAAGDHLTTASIDVIVWAKMWLKEVPA